MLAAEQQTLSVDEPLFLVNMGTGLAVMLLFTSCRRSNNNKYCTSQYESASPIIAKPLEEEMQSYTEYKSWPNKD